MYFINNGKLLLFGCPNPKALTKLSGLILHNKVNILRSFLVNFLNK